MSNRRITLNRTLRPLGLGLALLLASVPASHATDSTAALLTRANAAFAADRMASPAGDNALEWTLAARDIDPASERVREGINDLYPVVVVAIDAEIARGTASEAARMIQLLDRAFPGSLAARELRAKLVARFGAAGLPVAQVDAPR